MRFPMDQGLARRPDVWAELILVRVRLHVRSAKNIVHPFLDTGRLGRRNAKQAVVAG
jgi:hypothetical protein